MPLKGIYFEIDTAFSFGEGKRKVVKDIPVNLKVDIYPAGKEAAATGMKTGTEYSIKMTCPPIRVDELLRALLKPKEK